MKDKRYPLVVRVIFGVIGVISLVLVVGFLVEKMRQLIHWTSKKNVFYTLLMCGVMIGVCAFLLGQFKFGLDPWGKFLEWVKMCWENIREKIGGLISGK